MSILHLTGTHVERSINAWGWERFWQRVDREAIVERFEHRIRMDEAEEAARQTLVDKNFDIIKECLSNYTSQGWWRNLFAVYRLYRYLDVPFWEIKHKTNLQEGRIRDMVGMAFKYLCMNDNACVFKKYLRADIHDKEGRTKKTKA